jgi:hypothetical protein
MIQAKSKSKWPNKPECMSIIPNVMKIGQVVWNLLYVDKWFLKFIFETHFETKPYGTEYSIASNY